MTTPEQDELQATLDAQQTENRMLLADLRDANERLLLASLSAQLSADHAVAGRARAEDATKRLEVIERDLRVTAEFREQLLAIVGHDLRNPLGAISMAASLLLSRGRLGEVDARLVTRIINSGQRMTRLIAELFDFTRARLGGGMTLRLMPVDLAEVCRNALAELELTTTVPLRCEVEGDLRGNWDADRLSQVISNLVGNAVDYAAAGTAVVVKAFVDGAEVVAEVSNRGVPIPSDMLTVLFEPYHRAKKEESPSVKHLGLGLYIANQIVLAHLGTLAARSSAGTTTFTMRLARGVPAEKAAVLN